MYTVLYLPGTVLDRSGYPIAVSFSGYLQSDARLLGKRAHFIYQTVIFSRWLHPGYTPVGIVVNLLSEERDRGSRRDDKVSNHDKCGRGGQK